MNMSLKNKFAGMMIALMAVQVGWLFYALSGQEGSGKMIAIGAGLAVVLIGVGIGLANSWLLKPLSDITEKTRTMGVNPESGVKHEEGDGELGQLGRAINLVNDSYSNGIHEVSGAVDRIQVLCKEFSNVSGHDTDSAAMQKREAQGVVDAISQMTGTVHEVSQNATAAAQAARDANAEADSGQQVVNSVTSAIHSLADEVERAATAIQKLEEDSESIGAILEVIRGIADQTNLLALNAAIEAARAGEQGRGFAVVADEVRTLAQRTQEATEEINDMIARLQEGSSNAVKVMAEGRKQAELSVEQASKAGESLKAITTAISSISEMNDQIASAVEQQTASSDNISENLSRMSQLAEDDAEKVKSRTRLSQELIGAVDDLGRVVN